MAVRLITGSDRYMGLSGDPKPAGARTGSKFLETDTREVYLFDSATWSRMPMGRSWP